VKAYGDKFKDDSGSAKVPDALATLAYDATNLLLQAIQETGSEDTAKVKDSLAKIRFAAVSGLVTFDDQHNPVKSATILAVKADGVKFEAIVNP
jgi:branched-chain amino acid transport system substrate-binding protein